jgi:ribosomal protein S12 methylthiotransferase
MGFPGETEDQAAAVGSFVDAAHLDWVGTFTYSAEEGTRSIELDGHVDEVEARARTEQVASIADRAMASRAGSLVGRRLTVMAERFDRSEGTWTGRSHREAPEIDGEVVFSGRGGIQVGSSVDVLVTASEGADLVGVAEV